MLDHHDGIGAGRHGRAGHDLHALAGTYSAVEIAARLDLADAAQRRTRPRVGGADGEAIADGTIERRVIAIGRRRAAASTRPQARESSIVSASSGGRSARTVAITFSRASSKDSMSRSSEPGGELRSGSDDGGVALRAGRDHADFDLQLVGDELQVVERVSRQVFGVANALSGGLPAGQRAIFRANVIEILGSRQAFR